MQQSRTLVFASMVILLALLALRGHFGTMPLNGSNTAAVSVRLAAHMAELQIRHALATVGRFITIR